MTKNKPGVPPSKIPIIGDKDREIKEAIDVAMKQVIGYLDPILNNFGLTIEGLDKRVCVLEEVKKIFPDRVEVTIKHEELRAWKENKEKK